jgi:8-oxo-dGTP pyrophosphatase MutT (NUDIX family)
VRREISAAGVVYLPAPDGGFDVALGRRVTQAGKRVWCLPKGWIEPGEDAPKAAVREVREETGLTAGVEERLETVKYTYHDPDKDEDVFKIVVFFLMRYISGGVSGHDFELEEVRWLPIDEAVRLASYSSEKRVLRKARSILAGR